MTVHPEGTFWIELPNAAKSSITSHKMILGFSNQEFHIPIYFPIFASLNFSKNAFFN